MAKVLVWDFDGTLGYRSGGMWVATLLEIARRTAPHREPMMDQLHPYLQSGMPWHAPYQPHPEIVTPDQWWEAYEPVFERAFGGVGFHLSQAQRMAGEVRRVYPEPARFQLFDDTIPALERLALLGWTHVMLSNHVPELRDIIRHLGLKPYFAQIFNSAETGYEKPHPRAFQNVLDAFAGASAMWMIGDNMNADVTGAESMEIPGILVRRHHENARYFCADLARVPGILARPNAGTANPRHSTES